MKIAIVGPGAIGSTFAWQLSRAGHDVTVVARGARLATLERDQSIVRVDRSLESRASVTVSAALDETVPWDLVLVTVLATQVAAVLPMLAKSAAKRVMFMFNTFESIEPLRAAVGEGRFSFGFPGGVFTLLVDGRIHPQIRPGTTVSDPAIAELFSSAGIPTVVESDMQGWLRAHAAMVAPLMAMSTVVLARDRGATWGECKAYTAAFVAGFDIVRAVGSVPRPRAIASLSRLPKVILGAILWAFSRTKMLRDLGRLGTTEPRMLVDMMSDAAPQLAAPLRAIRP